MRLPVQNQSIGSVSVLLTLLLFAPPLVAQESPWLLTDGAMTHPEYRGVVPKRSDVVFSTRIKRDNSVEVANVFGATRVEWVYSTDKEFIRKLKATATWFSGALNANIRLPSDDGVARDFDGNPIVAPWAKGWGSKWITTTHPDTVKILRDQATRIIDAGADSIQIDEPLLQLHTASWGGDFNSATLEGFKKYLSTYPDRSKLSSPGIAGLDKTDYREFLKSRYGVKDNRDYRRRYRSLPTTDIWTRYLRDSVRQHFREFRDHLNGLRARPIPVSMNLGELDKPSESNRNFFLTEFSDYVIAETPIASPVDLVVRAATLRALGVGFVPSLLPRSLAENRVAIATLYALGTQPLVPWDVYNGNDDEGQPRRYFGMPEEYGDLYTLVKKNPELFDGTEATAVVGILIPVDRFRNAETMRLVQRLVESQVPFAFVLTGGTERKFKIDADRARRFKLLVTVNAESDFAPDELRALRSIPVRQLNPDQLTDEAIRQLAPLTVAGNMGVVKLYPRAIPASSGHRIVVHIVDESRGNETKSDHNCTRRVGLRKNTTMEKKLMKATWHSGSAVTPLTISGNNHESIVLIRECRLWGVLTLDLQ